MRTQRGYPSSTSSQSPKGKGAGKTGKRDRLQALIARTKCAKCGEKGHWARSCTSQAAGPKSTTPPQATRGSTFFLCGAEPAAMSSTFYSCVDPPRRRVWKSQCMLTSLKSTPQESSTCMLTSLKSTFQESSTCKLTSLKSTPQESSTSMLTSVKTAPKSS
eukprot:4474032-Amphidinium_carterae.1